MVLHKSDAYTLRRITGKDRNLNIESPQIKSIYDISLAPFRKNLKLKWKRTSNEHSFRGLPKLKNLDKSLKKDKEIVLSAVQQNGYSLKYADESLKKDKEIVLSAVQQNGYSLKYADESLKKDKEIVLSAVQQNGYSLKYADESLEKIKRLF